MDKIETMVTTYNHNVTINERKNIVISGVKKIDSFDNEEFLMDTTMGYMVIKGSELEIIKLDTYQGNVSIKGKVNSLTYMESANKKEKEDGILENYLNDGFRYSNCYFNFIFFIWNVFSFLVSVNYKYLYQRKILLRILFTFMFIFANVLIYFIILKKINQAILHPYSLGMILFGFCLEHYLHHLVVRFFKR